MNQKTAKMLRKISKIHSKDLNQLKKAWNNWSPEMKKKAVTAFKHSIKEWDRGLKMFKAEVAKDKLKKEKANEAKLKKSKRKKTRAKSRKRVAKKS